MLFEAPVAIGLIGHFVSAVNGGNLYRKTSFLLDSLGQAGVLAAGAHRGAAARAAGHGERARSTRRAWRRASAPIVRDGVVEGYFLGSYSARKLGMKTTGSAGGHHNLVVESRGPDFAAC